MRTTTDPIDITVLVCTFNRQACLKEALRSLVTLQTTPEFRFEILVVDDGSIDQTSSVVQSARVGSSVAIRYIRQDNKGVGAARNTGVINARTEWIAFFDDDQLADPGWLVHLVSSALSNNADCVGGPCVPLLPAGSSLRLSRTVRRLLGENPVMLEQRPENMRAVDPRHNQNAVPGTGNALVRRDLFDRIGLFSEIRRYGEDLQFFRRAQASGARIAIAPGAVVHHVIPAARLTQDSLLGLAHKGGASQGEIDAEVLGFEKAFCNAALRSVHLFLWTTPGLCLFWLLRDDVQLLSKKCSARFAVSYLRAVALGAGQHLTSRTCAS